MLNIIHVDMRVFLNRINAWYKYKRMLMLKKEKKKKFKGIIPYGIFIRLQDAHLNHEGKELWAYKKCNQGQWNISQIKLSYTHLRLNKCTHIILLSHLESHAAPAINTLHVQSFYYCNASGQQRGRTDKKIAREHKIRNYFSSSLASEFSLQPLLFIAGKAVLYIESTRWEDFYIINKQN